MKHLLFAVLLCLSAGASAGEAKPLADDPALEQRLIKLSEDLRCLVCQNESLAGSHAELAQDLRREIREQMRSGKNDQQVVGYLTQRYGDFVLYKPPLKPVTWLLWFGPFALLIGAAWGFYAFLKRRGAKVAEDTLSEEEQKRVEALLGINNNGKQS